MSQEKFLEHILKEAEREGPHPISINIPKQRLPHCARMFLRIIYLPVMVLDLSMQSLARKIIRPPYQKKGSCKRRGNCCRFILLPEAKGFFGRIYYFWQTEVNGFYVREISPADEEGNKMLILGCRHLSPSGKCLSYKTRPAVCRRWPMIEIFGTPRVLKGCGYSATIKSKLRT